MNRRRDSSRTNILLVFPGTQPNDQLEDANAFDLKVIECSQRKGEVKTDMDICGGGL